MAISSWKDLKVWRKSHDLVLVTYQLTKKFPSDERFGLTSQMRRASVSVASNIVEGYGRRTLKDSLNFYNNASASLAELKYQYFLSEELSYITSKDYKKALSLGDEAGKLLYAWSQSQKVNSRNG